MDDCSDSPGYWLNLFSHDTWQEFLNAGATVSGFPENRWQTLQDVRVGDMLLCYLTGLSRWIGLLRVTGAACRDTRPIWSDAAYPARLPVELVARLEPLTAVPVLELREKLSLFAGLRSPHAWTARFRRTLVRWDPTDGRAVEQAIAEALAHPVERPFDPAQLKRRPNIARSAFEAGGPAARTDAVAAGEVEEPAMVTIVDDDPVAESSSHTEIQHLLLTLGSQLGLDVWVARNDRGRTFRDAALETLPRVRATLPVQFDQATQRTIELIDVLWLKAHTIVAAFEIESTTSIYSGLLRMADLIAMQPNLTIPLYLVAPEARREEVVRQANRPAFARLDPPLAESYRSISFEALRQRVQDARPFLRHLQPRVIDDWAEPLVIPDV